MFHIGEDGEPRPCKAQQGNCPLSPEDEHHSTKDGARDAYEKSNAGQSLTSHSKQSFKIKDLKMESAHKEDLLTHENGDVYGFTLPAGDYVLVDPEELLVEEGDSAGKSPGWDSWAAASGASNGIGIDGEVYSARINGYPVSAIPAYTGSGEFEVEDNASVYTRSGLIAAVPVELADKMGYDHSSDPVIKIEADTSAVYLDSNNTISFGGVDVYTGYSDDEDDDYED